VGRTSLVRGVGSFICATALIWTALSGVAGASPARLLTARQAIPREEAAAAPLPNGKVLIVGRVTMGTTSTPPNSTTRRRKPLNHSARR